MNVPNYIPDQLEVQGNVAEQHQRVRVHFLRRVSLRFFFSVALFCALLRAPWPSANPYLVFGGWLGVIIVADILRILFRGEANDARATTIVFPLMLLGLSWGVHALPNWWNIATTPICGIACWTVYAWACGRDFSFVGCFLLSLIASSVCIAMATMSDLVRASEAPWAFALNAVVLFYGLYDLASIQSRRRVGEEWAAAADLYRDFLNIFGYVPRVIRHWKKYPVWNITR